MAASARGEYSRASFDDDDLIDPDDGSCERELVVEMHL